MSDFRKTDDLDGMETHAASDDDKVTIVRTQDVEPYLETNKRMFNDGDGYSPSRDMRRVASIPLVVVEAWLKEGVNIFDPGSAEEIRRRLNDPSWRYLRTSGGRL